MQSQCLGQLVKLPVLPFARRTKPLRNAAHMPAVGKIEFIILRLRDGLRCGAALDDVVSRAMSTVLTSSALDRADPRADRRSPYKHIHAR